ncbi:hypothetical protein E2C01_010540 [Portunus trituberculatus]|uniref:Uncharacterized protein n=1 Tax=Portunus trituberculatus TaxID=210409 RepID=A0A5B7D921_PORTR|nr:hypothetical protein [Portunus trituberculatus]
MATTALSSATSLFTTLSRQYHWSHHKERRYVSSLCLKDTYATIKLVSHWCPTNPAYHRWPTLPHCNIFIVLLMDVSGFYGKRNMEESSDEDFVPSSLITSSDSDENDESES